MAGRRGQPGTRPTPAGRAGRATQPRRAPAPPADAREVVQYGLLGMLVHGAPLESRQWMAAFAADQAFAFFNIDSTGERAGFRA